MGKAPISNRVRDDNAAQRAAQAYKLWLKGWSFPRIAEALNYSGPGSAYKAYKRAKAAVIFPDDLAEEVQRERERLEIAYAGIADKVEAGDHWSIDRAVAIAERKAKLLGLDAKEDATTAQPYTKRVTLHRSSQSASQPIEQQQQEASA